MNSTILDPIKIAKTLDAWILESLEAASQDDCWEDEDREFKTFNIVLSAEPKEETDIAVKLMMSLYLTSEKPDFVSLSISLPNNNGNTLVAFREITNVVYQPARKKVIIESYKNSYYSILELERVHTWINATINVNLTKKGYENSFKNY